MSLLGTQVGLLVVAGGWIGPPAAAVPADTVVIRFSPDAATVTQRLPALDGVVDAHAIRLDGQELRVDGAARAGEPLYSPGIERLPGAYHLRISGRVPVDLRYRVTGRLDRIPLFVSSPEAQLASAPVTLRVELTPASSQGLDLGTSLPRFRRSSEGTLTATLSSTPTFVRLDPAGGLSFARAADLAVVVLILLAAVWAWRTARRSDVLTAGTRSPRNGDVA
jgi:hypothetical protein